MAENTITHIRKDIRTLKAVVAADVEVTDVVLDGVWRWFSDVELAVPLQVMELSDSERSLLATEIIAEMDACFSRLEKMASKPNVDLDMLAHTSDGRQVDLLWKELAGVYADLINDEVPELPEELKQEIHERIVEELSEQFGVTEDEIRHKIRTDSSLRMRLRMSGLSPDQIQ